MNEEEAKEICINFVEENKDRPIILHEAIKILVSSSEKKDRTIQQLKDENKTLNRQAQQYFEQGIKKDRIIYEIAKSNVKLKGYDAEETYINNTISFYTKYIENLERNPHWRKESRKWKLKQKNG